MNLDRQPVSPEDDLWTLPADVEQSIPARFAQQVQLHADRTAIHSATWQPTYRQLDLASRRVAMSLRSIPATQGARVLLLARHDSPLLAGMLGTLQAGRVAVILNPTDPVARLAHLSRHAGANSLLADSEYLPLARQLARASDNVVCVDDHLDGSPVDGPCVPVAPSDAAFLVYTSGSTAAPKGVIRSHRSIVHNAFRHCRGMGLQPGDRLLHLSALSGASGVSGACTALLCGVTLCPFPVMEQGVTGLADWVRVHRISALSLSSSLFRNFMRIIPEDFRFPEVRVVRLTAEPAMRDDFTAFCRHFPGHCNLIHTLSSSETGTIARLCLTPDDLKDKEQLPIGHPADGVELLLLDQHGRPVSPGEVGEITVRSRYLSSGYWRAQAMTATRFSFSRDGMITFRSGDLARMNADGQLEFSGRVDTRIKVRGYRIEPSEIEAALRQLPGVAEAVVCAQAKENNDARLVAWLTRRDDQTVDADVLRNLLRDMLPAHMLPNAFVYLDRFPIASNGKINRAKLREMPVPDVDGAADSEPATNTEIQLARIWADAFRRESVGRNDEFFNLGGDSLVAAVIAARVHAELAVELRLAAFTAHATLSDLATEIDRLRTFDQQASGSPLVPVPRQEPLPLSFAQELAWQHSQTQKLSAQYTVVKHYWIRGPLDIETFRESLAYVIGRHEIFRTTFETRQGQPVQIIHPHRSVCLEQLDFSNSPDPVERVSRFVRDQSKTVFDLTCWPLLQFWLIRIGPDQHALLRINHHIISDSLSTKLLFREWSAIYEAKRNGEAAPLPTIARLHYGDYAAWQRLSHHSNAGVYQGIVQWWKDHLTDLPRPRKRPYLRRKPRPDAVAADGMIERPLDDSLIGQLDEIAHAQRSTRFTVLLAAVAPVLGAVLRRQDVVMATFLSTRNHVELQNMPGYFVDSIVFRLRYDQEWSLNHWIGIVRDTMNQVQAHPQIPFQQIREALQNQGIRPPVIDLAFRLREANEPVRFGKSELSLAHDVGQSMPRGCALVVSLREPRSVSSLKFDAAKYDPSHMTDLLDQYMRFLAAASKEPHLPLSQLLEKGRGPKRTRVSSFWPWGKKAG